MGNISNALYLFPLFIENLSYNFQINPFIAFVLKVSTSFHNSYK